MGPEELATFVRALRGAFGQRAVPCAGLARELRVSADLANAAPFTVRQALLAPGDDFEAALRELVEAAAVAAPTAGGLALRATGSGRRRRFQIVSGRAAASGRWESWGNDEDDGQAEDEPQAREERRPLARPRPRSNGRVCVAPEPAQEPAAPAVEVIQRAPRERPPPRVNGATAAPRWTPDPEQLLYPTADVTAATGLPARLIRSWTRAGLVAPVFPTPGGRHARYSASAIRALRLAAALRKGGVSTRCLRAALPAVLAEVEALVAEAAAPAEVSEGGASEGGPRW